MTPPIRSAQSLGTSPSTSTDAATAVSAETTGPGPDSGPRTPTYFMPRRLLNLRPEFTNPIRSSRPIANLGDVRRAIAVDFVKAHLVGAKVINFLGSSEIHTRPERPIEGWDPDKKPDLNVVGNSETMLRGLAPLMGWDARTLEANIERARHGMVYFNLAEETRAGPIPIKMGIIDQWLLEQGGESYFSLRASLLPDSLSYEFLDDDPAFRQRFEQWSVNNKARFLEHSLNSLFLRRSFDAADLVERRFRLQFTDYELYRVFDYNKGPKQAARLEPWIPEILVPGLRRYLETHHQLKVYDPSGMPGIELSPDMITPENFSRLQFTWQRGFFGRAWAALRDVPRFLRINASMARQTLRNIGSNGTSREGYHQINWFRYGVRKFSRLFGVGGESVPRAYHTEASTFATDAERQGRTATPLRQMVILAGYDPGNENDPNVFKEIVRYAESELTRGSIPNPLFKGIEPSKFTLPVRGVPNVAFQLMNALMSDGIEHVALAGTPDTKIVFDRFVEFYRDEIEARGKQFRFVEMGNSFTSNLRKGIAASPYRDEPVVLGFGDNPLIDMERIVHHPERRLVDWIVAVNSRTRLMHDGAKNYHVDGQHEGVSDPAKEGNAYTYPGDPNRVPWDLLQAIFDSRKSMADGGRSKFSIILETLFGRNLMDRRLYSPTVIDSFHFLADFMGRAARQQFQRMVLRQKVPAAGLDLELSERLLDSRLRWKTSLFPNHSDPGGVLDVDGVLDLAIAKGVLEGTEHPETIYPHWDMLAPFADAIKADGDRLPALEGSPQRINRMFERIRDALIEKGFSDEVLRAKGFNPDSPPMLDDGRINPQYLETLFPNGQFQYFRQAWEAYNRRASHAAGLEEGFLSRVEATVPAEERPADGVERFVFSHLNVDPERSRSLLIEWDFTRLNDAILGAARARYGKDNPFVQQVERYVAESTGNADTALRRVYTGLKAVDVLRRSTANLSPEEYRSLYSQLVESIYQARSAVPTSQRRLLQYLNHAQTTADREFVRKVGESPPPYRARGLGGLFASTNGRDPVRRERGLAPTRPIAVGNGAANNNSAEASPLPSVRESNSGVRAMTEVQGQVRRVDSPAYFDVDLHQFARRLEILPSRIPHLVAAASGADTRERLSRIVSERMTVERLREWVQSSEGQRYMNERGAAFRDTFQNRLREGGPGLAVGVVSMLGAEQLADVVGLDARHHPQERFMFVVALSHVAGQGTAALSEVFLNRSLGSAFNFVGTRTVMAGGETAVQFSFEARSSLSRALFDSLTRNFGLEGGLGRILWNGSRGLVTMPFRAAWGMGPGLMSSAIVDRTIGSLFPEGSRERNALRFGSFFIPDIYRIGVGNRGPAIFESAGLRWASRAFAAGFVADMVFSGANRWQYGAEGSATMNSIYHRANQLHDQNESWWRRPIDGAFEMIAPSLSAWWDSVEFHGFSVRPNSYQVQAREELRSFSSQTSERSDSLLRRALLMGSGSQNLDPSFYTRVDWSLLRGSNALTTPVLPDGRELPVQDVYEQLQDPAVQRRLSAPGFGHDQQVAYIQQQFRGYRLSRGEVEQILDRIELHAVRNDLASLSQIALPETADLRRIYDDNGALRPGQEQALLGRLYGDRNVSEADLLRQRRVALATQILQAQSSSNPSAAEPYLAVARQIGLADASGAIVDSEIRGLAQAQDAALRGQAATNPSDGIGVGSPSQLSRLALAARLSGFASSRPSVG